ncbi:MAG TPA: LppP/LprE family lipoprotein [Solirubrobacteraceae bacterium]|nr:LppP/LprE family lipoprotein [Solirubrobacteraceae bacterium]
MTTTALAAAVAVLLGGCGGATKTVSVAGAPTTSQTTATTTQPTTGAATTPAHTTSGATSGGGASGGAPATTTRTAPAPAFADKERGGGAEGLPAALAVVRAHGYTASDTADYHPSQTLRVLVGTGSHSNDGYDKQAFFFLDGRYLGTDSSRPSAQLGVVSQSDTEVTLVYKLYRPSDPLCCPGGGQARVRFQLNNGRLVPLDPIPPVSSTTGTSRQ